MHCVRAGDELVQQPHNHTVPHPRPGLEKMARRAPQGHAFLKKGRLDGELSVLQARGRTACAASAPGLRRAPRLSCACVLEIIARQDRQPRGEKVHGRNGVSSNQTLTASQQHETRFRGATSPPIRNAHCRQTTLPTGKHMKGASLGVAGAAARPPAPGCSGEGAGCGRKASWPPVWRSLRPACARGARLCAWVCVPSATPDACGALASGQHSADPTGRKRIQSSRAQSQLSCMVRGCSIIRAAESVGVLQILENVAVRGQNARHACVELRRNGPAASAQPAILGHGPVCCPLRNWSSATPLAVRRDEQERKDACARGRNGFMNSPGMGDLEAHAIPVACASAPPLWARRPRSGRRGHAVWHLPCPSQLMPSPPWRMASWGARGSGGRARGS